MNLKLKKDISPQRALRWAISITLPSLLLFSANQILISWNVSNLLTKVEISENVLKAYKNSETKGEPKQGEESAYWGEHGGDIEYIGPKDRWARRYIVPAAEKYLPELKIKINELKKMNFFAFDQDIRIARDSYIKHASVWSDILEETISCGKRDSDTYLYRCISDIYYYEGSDQINRTWDVSRLEFIRISPMFDLYDNKRRAAIIFDESDS